MKRAFYITSFFCFLISHQTITGQADVQDEIRRKLETSSNQNIKAAGEIIYCKKKLIQLYHQRLFMPVWTEGKMIEDLILSVKNAGKEGLNPNDYHLEFLEKIRKEQLTLSVIQKAEFDLLLTDTYLLYSSHLLSGKINPVSIDPEWHVSRREGDPVLSLINAAESRMISVSLQAMVPKNETYQGLKQALARYENIHESGGWVKVPEGETLKKGIEHERVGILRKRLQQSKDIISESVESNVYDESLFNAVVKFQKRHGLAADGTIGKETIEALNVHITDRIEQLKANMERWRWLPQDFGTYYLKVNIADFKLTVVKNQKVEQEYKVIVGRDYRRTPVFNAQISYLVLNPTWTVPPGILKADILPAVRKNPSYLKSKNISVLDASGNVLNQGTIDWNSKLVNGYTYRQAPGPDNALGAVKFMFPNSFNVYLHDTPSKDLFDKEERAFSSGCIRVEKPLDLAAYILKGQEGWNPEKIQQQVAGKKTITVPIQNKPNVFILYWTAQMDEEGNVQFKKDIYKRDSTLITKLKEKPPLN